MIFELFLILYYIILCYLYVLYIHLKIQPWWAEEFKTSYFIGIVYIEKAD